MNVDTRLPNFFVLGATKAGTTTLYEYLKEHPEIYLSKVKEPQFFCNETLFSKGIEFYLSTYFKGSENFLLRGDTTPHYIYYEKVAKRLAEVLPPNNQKFIVMLRDPVKRAYSLYWNMVYEGLEELSFEDALCAEEERKKDPNLSKDCSVSYQYVDSSKYAAQIRRYLKYFDISQFLILFVEDLKVEKDRILFEIFEFLGAKSDIQIKKQDSFNQAGLPRFRLVHDFIRKSNRIKKQVGRLLPHHIKYQITSKILELNKQNIQYPPLSKSLEQSLRQKFKEDILDLQNITKRSLKIWLP